MRNMIYGYRAIAVIFIVFAIVSFTAIKIEQYVKGPIKPRLVQV